MGLQRGVDYALLCPLLYGSHQPKQRHADSGLAIARLSACGPLCDFQTHPGFEQNNPSGFGLITTALPWPKQHVTGPAKHPRRWLPPSGFLWGFRFPDVAPPAPGTSRTPPPRLRPTSASSIQKRLEDRSSKIQVACHWPTVLSCSAVLPAAGCASSRDAHGIVSIYSIDQAYVSKVINRECRCSWTRHPSAFPPRHPSHLTMGHTARRCLHEQGGRKSSSFGARGPPRDACAGAARHASTVCRAGDARGFAHARMQQ